MVTRKEEQRVAQVFWPRGYDLEPLRGIRNPPLDTHSPHNFSPIAVGMPTDEHPRTDPGERDSRTLLLEHIRCDHGFAVSRYSVIREVSTHDLSQPLTL